MTDLPQDDLVARLLNGSFDGVTSRRAAARITALETALREAREAVKAAYKEGRDAGLCERYDYPTDADEHFAWGDSEAKAFLDGSAIPSCGEG